MIWHEGSVCLLVLEIVKLITLTYNWIKLRSLLFFVLEWFKKYYRKIKNNSLSLYYFSVKRLTIIVVVEYKQEVLQILAIQSVNYVYKSSFYEQH